MFLELKLTPANHSPATPRRRGGGQMEGKSISRLLAVEGGDVTTGLISCTRSDGEKGLLLHQMLMLMLVKDLTWKTISNWQSMFLFTAETCGPNAGNHFSEIKNTNFSLTHLWFPIMFFWLSVAMVTVRLSTHFSGRLNFARVFFSVFHVRLRRCRTTS